MKGRRVFDGQRGVAAAIFGASIFVNLLVLTAPLYMLQLVARVMASGSIPTLIALTAGAGIALVFFFLFDVIRQRLVARLSPVVLDGRRAGAQMAILESQLASLLAQQARLAAELADAPEMQIPAELAALTAADPQLALVRSEIAGLTLLYDKGLVPKTRLSDRQLQESGLLGTLGALDSDRGNILERIGEMEERVLQVSRGHLSRATAENKVVQEQVLDLRQRRDAILDVQERLVIRAPRAGRVAGLRINTLGQVLEPGEQLLELVPADTGLILETRVAISDIGEVVMVAADATQDAATGQACYPVHIRIPEAELAALPNVKALPGMPGQAMIETGRQTLAEYLISPVLASMSQALKEGES